MTDDPPPGSGNAVPRTRQSIDPVGRVPGGLIDNVMLSAAQVDAHTRHNSRVLAWCRGYPGKQEVGQITRGMNKTRPEVRHFEHC